MRQVPDWQANVQMRFLSVGPVALPVMLSERSFQHAAALHADEEVDGGKVRQDDVARARSPLMDTNRIHEVDINYCACDHRGGSTRRQQLLRFGWYPATLYHPCTCATLTLLDQFHALMLASKVLGYDFYKYLMSMTDAWGINLPKRKYKSLLRMVCQYRHLKMMMRVGRGQEENGIKTTSPRGLALHCPACPIPYVNLPAGWELASRSISFLYHGILALDANFRLKNLFRSTKEADPGLHTGLAYFIKHTLYLLHLSKYVTQTDILTCSGFKTLRQAETRGETSLRASGVAMCVCARHEMVCATGVSDLQKGERYANMDYVIMSGAASLGLQNLFVLYDIACQWNINFKTRMKELPSHLQLRGGIGLSCGVPKLHAKVHKMACQCEYAIGIQFGTGWTDGEGIKLRHSMDGSADGSGSVLRILGCLIGEIRIRRCGFAQISVSGVSVLQVSVYISQN
ncbi:uncharacterized protein ARMOST_17753 [Armillaria ostoyae]|uniref:CxC2-like cysteine cluster KDZ transposase-associated domain-containing protein n=1 Tax=Armillaria ostoyae TaxID=47428 RepID=A0A284RZZ8_ARMOS|nr:uncharacterized protein ARMOST_17753 [Armillaria ostoyae]